MVLVKFRLAQPILGRYESEALIRARKTIFLEHLSLIFGKLLKHGGQCIFPLTILGIFSEVERVENDNTQPFSK